MQKWKTREEKTLRNISKMLRQVERNLEQDDVQVCANRYGAFIDANHENILLMKINRKLSKSNRFDRDLFHRDLDIPGLAEITVYSKLIAIY